MSKNIAEVNLSFHAKVRVKQRHDKKGSEAKALVDRVIRNGRRREVLTGSLKRWVDHKYLMHGQSGEHIVHGGFLYAFSSDNTLITTYNIPEDVLSNKKFRNRSLYREKYQEQTPSED